MKWRTTSVVIGLGLVAAACGTGDVGADTPEPTESTVAATTMASTTGVDTIEEPWDLFVLGDSFTAKSGWPEQLAELASKEVGVDLAVSGKACFGGCTSLREIQASEILRSQIEEAEIVVLQPQPGRVVLPMWDSYFSDECGGTDGRECMRRALTEFREYVEDLFDEVIALSEPGTIIRATQTGTWGVDAFHPDLRDTDPETFEELLGFLVAFGKHIAEAAAERCIPVLDVNALLTGSDYHERINPEYSNDGKHPSQEGSRVIAESLHDLGYLSTAC